MPVDAFGACPPPPNSRYMRSYKTHSLALMEGRVDCNALRRSEGRNKTAGVDVDGDDDDDSCRGGEACNERSTAERKAVVMMACFMKNE